MRKITLRNNPSQEITVRFNRKSLRMRWMFNSVSGYWSLTVWVDDERCPRMAGKRVIDGFNLFEGYDFNDVNAELWVAIRPDNRITNWYDRLRFNPSGALIVLMSPEERQGIIDEFTAEQQPC